MEMPGFIKRIQHWVEDEDHWLTRQKIIVFGATLILIGILLGIFESGAEQERATPPDIIDLPLPDRQPQKEAEPPEEDGPADLSMAPGTDAWESVKVRSGQTLDAIFRQQGFSISLLHQILALKKSGPARSLTSRRTRREIFSRCVIRWTKPVT
jgi:cell envelope opacity-associated protein A